MSDTPDTTRLSGAHVRRMLGATAFIDPPDAAKDVKALCHAYLTLAADLARVTAENARLRQALDTVIAEAGAIWDDDNPVHPAHGSRLDTMLFAAKTAIAAPSAADRDHAGESGA